MLCVQYWYEGDEAGDLPVDFSIVWDGDFFIDKPTSMKGNLVPASGVTSETDVEVWVPSRRGSVEQRCTCLFSALLYKCEAQRSSCGQCLKAPPAFECGWCVESKKCLLRQHCPTPEQSWMHHGRHNLRCSHPRITKVGRPVRFSG